MIFGQIKYFGSYFMITRSLMRKKIFEITISQFNFDLWEIKQVQVWYLCEKIIKFSIYHFR
jgi:hypothetical protein